MRGGDPSIEEFSESVEKSFRIFASTPRRKWFYKVNGPWSGYRFDADYPVSRYRSSLKISTRNGSHPRPRPSPSPRVSIGRECLPSFSSLQTFFPVNSREKRPRPVIFGRIISTLPSPLSLLFLPAFVVYLQPRRIFLLLSEEIVFAAAEKENENKWTTFRRIESLAFPLSLSSPGPTKINNPRMHRERIFNRNDVANAANKTFENVSSFPSRMKNRHYSWQYSRFDRG